MPKLKKKTAVIIFAVILFFLPWIVFPLYNNIVAANYLKQLESLPLPPQTEICGSVWEVGKLSGNGDNTDYAAVIIISSELMQNELEKHYAIEKFSPARSSHSRHTIDIGEVQDGRMNTSGLRLSKPMKITFEDRKNYFYIIFYDSGYPALFDIRSG